MTLETGRQTVGPIFVTSRSRLGLMPYRLVCMPHYAIVSGFLHLLQKLIVPNLD